MMNTRTRDDLKAFIDQVAILAQGVVHSTGIDSCAELLQAAQNLKDSIDADETLTEVR